MRRPSRPGLPRYWLSVAGPLFVTLFCLAFRAWPQNISLTITAPGKPGDTLNINPAPAQSLDSICDVPAPRQHGDDEKPPASFVSGRDDCSRDRPDRPRQNGMQHQNLSLHARRHYDYSAPKTSH